ncbi:hypothetical protein QCA50_005455 [Cerrena zonata]|uniref:Cytochrome P450 n=1 Tax=Cerrena zonata TaxID=2478898 RepID=A0AAW0GS22_9APHY
MAPSLFILDSALVVLGLYILRRYFINKNRPPVPPGPRGLPFVGNVLDMPTSYEWLAIAEWTKRWGDIIHVNVLGKHFVFLHSAEDAVALLDKRSSKYSDRPTLTMGGEMVGWVASLGLTRYSDRFRESRRFFNRIIGTKNALRPFHELVETEIHKFLRRLVYTPENVHEHIRKTASGIIMKITYGYSVTEGKDPYVDIVDKAMENFSVTTTPGAFLVDVLPILRYVPSWVPGAKFQKLATEWRAETMAMAETPFAMVKQQMREGTALPSYTKNLLETETLTPEKEDNIKWSAASMYGGGADTTVSAIYSFFLAMTMYPEIQQKAKEEIDRVVGKDRLPTFADRENLPYVEAVVNEVLRLNPVAPLGVPHRASEDDIYKGYFIPKDTVVIANIWALLRDPEMYPDPSAFNPDRYLRPNPDRNPRDFVFGFGRRICPGLNLADTTVFFTCAMALATFDISKAVENGVVIEPSGEYTAGTVSHPKEFKCSIKPRSFKASSLILAEFEQ